MSKEIGPWNGVQVRIHLAGNEGGHGKVFGGWSILSDGMTASPDHEDQDCCPLCLSVGLRMLWQLQLVKSRVSSSLLQQRRDLG